MNAIEADSRRFAFIRGCLLLVGNLPIRRS
jgi:hypothetical protein